MTDFGKQTARLLLDIGAVNFRPSQPYILTSGWASPVYIDCRKIISFPKTREKIMEYAVSLIKHTIDLAYIDGIVGGETAGIPYAAWIAQLTKKPMQYVRKKPKGFGRNEKIEGHLPEGSKVILIEDLATDGASKVNFINSIRDTNVIVHDIFVIFFYDIFPETLNILNDLDVNLHFLTSWHHILEEAKFRKDFKSSDLKEVEDFLSNPIAWSNKNGGKQASL